MLFFNDIRSIFEKCMHVKFVVSYADMFIKYREAVLGGTLTPWT